MGFKKNVKLVVKCVEHENSRIFNLNPLSLALSMSDMIMSKTVNSFPHPSLTQTIIVGGQPLPIPIDKVVAQGYPQ